LRFTIHLCNAIYFSIIFNTPCKRFTKILHFAFWDLNRAWKLYRSVGVACCLFWKWCFASGSVYRLYMLLPLTSLVHYEGKSFLALNCYVSDDPASLFNQWYCAYCENHFSCWDVTDLMILLISHFSCWDVNHTVHTAQFSEIWQVFLCQNETLIIHRVNLPKHDRNLIRLIGPINGCQHVVLH